ncbi:hypothetical protein [Sulfurimonas sp. HSL-1716]|uniref:hypothetical protein n=1 Tax=Hydrocurvibacter sulfurireducens TaxID=3131937 RepID=UPI0031F83DF7
MKIISIFLIVFSFLGCANIKTSYHSAHGIDYSPVNTKSQVQKIQELSQGTQEQKNSAIEEIKNHSDKYAPAVFFPVARELFKQGKMDEALFWFHAGRIRTIFDIKRCTDPTVKGAVVILSRNLPSEFYKKQAQNPDLTEKMIFKAINWDKATPYNYDPRWIALHGIGAFQGKLSPQLVIPEYKWGLLADQNRRKYLQTSLNILQRLRSKK